MTLRIARGLTALSALSTLALLTACGSSTRPSIDVAPEEVEVAGPALPSFPKPPVLRGAVFADVLAPSDTVPALAVMTIDEASAVVSDYAAIAAWRIRIEAWLDQVDDRSIYDR